MDKRNANEVRPLAVGMYVPISGIVYRVRKVVAKMGRIKDVVLRPMCTVDEYMAELARHQAKLPPRPAAPITETDIVSSLGG